MNKNEIRLKNVLILLLMLTALYLLISNTASTLTGVLGTKNSVPSDKLRLIMNNGEGDDANIDPDRLQPEFIGISAAEDVKAGVFSDRTMINTVYGELSKDVSLLLSDQSEYSQSDDEVWRACFGEERYVFIDYGADLSAAVITAYATTSQSQVEKTAPALLSQLFMFYTEDGIRGVSRSFTGKVYEFICPLRGTGTGVYAYTDRAELASFRLTAGENGADYEMDAVSYTNVITVKSDVITEGKANEEYLYGFFKLVGYNTNNLSAYHEPLTKTSVYIGNQGDTVSVSAEDMRVRYESSVGLDLRDNFQKGTVNDLYGYLGCAEHIAEKLEDISSVPYGGLVLAYVRYEDGIFEFYYEYESEGIALIGSRPALTVKMREGKLIYIDFLPITVEHTGEMTKALPKSLLESGNFSRFAYYVDSLGSEAISLKAQWRYGEMGAVK